MHKWRQQRTRRPQQTPEDEELHQKRSIVLIGIPVVGNIHEGEKQQNVRERRQAVFGIDADPDGDTSSRTEDPKVKRPATGSCCR